MKRLFVALLSLALLVPTAGAFAYNVGTASNGSFQVVGPAATFSNWVTSTGGTLDRWETYLHEGFGYMSGAKSANDWGFAYMNFQFDKPLETCILNYSASAFSYGDNYGYAEAYVTVGTQKTLVLRVVADKTESPYNYTASQTPNKPATWWTGYTDISALVAGQSAFNLTFETYRGWSDWRYNGGQMIIRSDANGIGGDFVMSGTTAAVPEPSSMIALAFGLLPLAGAIRRRK